MLQKLYANKFMVFDEVNHSLKDKLSKLTQQSPPTTNTAGVKGASLQHLKKWFL